MKKGLPTTSSPDDENFNPIVPIPYEEIEDSEAFKEKFKLLALTVACKKVAEKNYLTLEQQMNIWIPKAWREE